MLGGSLGEVRPPGAAGPARARSSLGGAPPSGEPPGGVECRWVGHNAGRGGARIGLQLAVKKGKGESRN